MFKRNKIKNPLRKSKGQSTVEYIILVAAVIGALIIFLPGTFQTAYEDTLSHGTNGMVDMGERLSASRYDPNAN